MADLSELFARLKAQNPNSNSQQTLQQPSIFAQPAYQQSSVSSPLFSPPIQTPNSADSSDVKYPAKGAGTPVAGADQNRTNNLLNLLKFNSQSSQKNEQTSALASLQNVARSPSFNNSANIHASGASQPRVVSASDMVASFQQKPSSNSQIAPSPLVERPDAKSEGRITPLGNPQDFLMNLLQKPRDSNTVKKEAPMAETTKQGEVSIDALAQSFKDANIQAMKPEQEQKEKSPTPVRFGSTDAASTPFEMPKPNKATMFMYRNPFDDLAASSPRNIAPQPQTMPKAEEKRIEILKHGRDFSSNTHNGDQPAQKTRKLDALGKVANSASAPELEQKESVSQALSGVGEKVDKQVEEALAQADVGNGKITETIEKTADGAADVKPEDDDVAESWESANEAEEQEEFKVEVFNFPMRPFVAIKLTPSAPSAPGFRPGCFMTIAQLKKEFDQIDRTLATASRSHIVYAQVATKKDNGGFRVIRQDTGHHRQAFRSSGDRIFHLQICSSPHSTSDSEAVLATGISGSVYWTALSTSKADDFDGDDFEAQGFMMPPVATSEDSAPLKTRAKTSSRHPDFFGIARGKQIHIIAPFTALAGAYCDATTRKMDSAKYFDEHGLKIYCGKGVKDFAFSEDDSVLVSLDKNGRIKFWDIRQMADLARNKLSTKHEAVDLKTELHQVRLATDGGKVSCSSIMFVDKERPCTKGVALRYMIVGLQQNHVLQLWDLGLGKAVQELHLPHDKDSDPICSISYHPKSGIIAVGHPTRNSIYLIHLSAPKYHIPHMDQARYVSMLALNDPLLPRPESTAIMSGMREFSFASKGQMRSVDMLRMPVTADTGLNPEDEVMFELYAMHSKGVVGMSLKREDLGWDSKGTVIKANDALASGVIELADISKPSTTHASGGSERSESRDATPKPKAKKDHVKETPVKKDVALPASPAGLHAIAAKGTPSRTSKPGSKQVPEAPAPSQPMPSNPALIPPESYAMAAQRAKSPLRKAVTPPSSKPAGAGPKGPEKLEGMTDSTARSMNDMLSNEFEALYQRIDADKRVHDAAAAANRDAMLRLVSSVLTENVEKSLARIIEERIEHAVIPTLETATTDAIDKHIAAAIGKQLEATAPREIKASLPGAIGAALKEESVQRLIAERTAKQVGAVVQHQVTSLLQNSMPNISQQASQSTQKLIANFEARQQQMETQRQADSSKIEQLSNLVRSLSETVHNMAEGQSAFQEQILRSQRPASRSTKDGGSATATTTSDPQLSAEEEEMKEIERLLVDGNYEQGTIMWLQSNHQAYLFDRLFVRCNPQYLTKLTPLVTLSVSAAITASFDSYVNERLEWLRTVLSTINLNDEDIRDVAPKIMDVLSQRLQGAYMQIAEQDATNPALKQVSQLARSVLEVRKMTA